MSSPPPTRPSIGGQAVVEGVMMRARTSFAVAVRKPDSEIACETHLLPGHPERHPWLRWPFIRGMYIIFESLSVGMAALRISTRHSLGEHEQVSGKQMGWTMGLAFAIFTAIFIIAPAAASKLGGRLIGVDGSLGQNLIEGALRIGLFLGYILAISFVPDIRRVFQYHGAEHKTIYAYENGDPLVPGVIDRYPTLHVRCGTNFLFIVMFFTIAVHFVMDLVLPASIPIRIGARVLAIPLLAGGAYEVIRGASRNERSRVFHIVSLPGLALQKITTRPPTPDQIEVAVTAMEAVMAAEGIGATPAPRASASETFWAP